MTMKYCSIPMYFVCNVHSYCVVCSSVVIQYVFMYFALQESGAAVNMPFRNKLLNRIDATCEISTADFNSKLN